MSCTRFPLMTCVKQESNRKTKVLLYEHYYSKGDKNYFFYETLDHIRAERCIDCITLSIQYSDLSYENLKKDSFDVWFTAIEQHRLDVLEKLLEYGCERYSEYIDDKGRDSYCVLIESFMKHATLTTEEVVLEKITEIFELFIAAGIPVDEESIRKTIDNIIEKYLSVILPYISFLKNLIEKHGYYVEIVD